MFKKNKTWRWFSSVVRKLEKLGMKETKTVKFPCEKSCRKDLSTILLSTSFACINVFCVIEAVILVVHGNMLMILNFHLQT